MKKKFLMNLMLTFVWVALTGKFMLVNFVFWFRYSASFCCGAITWESEARSLFLPDS